MRNNFSLNFAILLCCLILMGCGNTNSTPDIEVLDVWSRPVTLVEKDVRGNGSGHAAQHGSGVNGVVYMTVRNNSSVPDVLVSVDTEVAETVELHETKVEGDHMMMAKLDSGIEIQPDSEVRLKPGGKHIMLIGLKQPLVEGGNFDLTLTFEKSGHKTVTSDIKMQ